MEELLKRVEELEKENTRLKKEKEYGLVWEEFKEENETVDYTITRDETMSINPDKTGVLKHKIIEGDNLLALRELKVNYSEKNRGHIYRPPL